jgi:hypothetical protein
LYQEKSGNPACDGCRQLLKGYWFSNNHVGSFR